MKILILVQGCDDEPFKRLNHVQRLTWDKEEHPNVTTLFYLSDSKLPKDSVALHAKSKSLYVDGSEAYNMMHWRMKRTLDAVWDQDWDFIFRTNSSSYINKNLLYEWALTQPLEKTYCGIDGGGFASGCGVLISRDLIDIIRKNIDEYPTDSEDCCMGSILSKRGYGVTKGAERFDVYFNAKHNIKHFSISGFPITYHYRCKSDTPDREKDVAAFIQIHKEFETWPV